MAAKRSNVKDLKRYSFKWKENDIEFVYAQEIPVIRTTSDKYRFIDIRNHLNKDCIVSAKASPQRQRKADTDEVWKLHSMR